MLGPSSVTVVDEDAVRQNLTTFDVVFFPGGFGSKEAAGLGSEGLEAVKAFVAAGGGYIGTCAGAFLGMKSLLFYGAGSSGSGPPVQSLGEGLVDVGFSELGLQQLHLDPKVFGGNVSIFYEGGPVVAASDLPSNVSVLAWYRSPVPSSLPKPQGVGTPAVTSALYGHGRVILNSPHAEHTQSGGIGAAFYAGELAWVLGSESEVQVHV